MSNSTDKTGCISHRANSRFFIMYEDYLEIAAKLSFEHRHKLAAFWRVLETKTNDRITYNEELIKDAEKRGLPVPETDLWVEVPYSEFVNRSLETYKSSSFQVASAESERLAFSKSKNLKRRVNPLDPQSPLEDYKEYLFFADVMQSAINEGKYPIPIEINSPLLKSLNERKEKAKAERAIKNNRGAIENNTPPIEINSDPLLKTTGGAIENNRNKNLEVSSKDDKDSEKESTVTAASASVTPAPTALYLHPEHDFLAFDDLEHPTTMTVFLVDDERAEITNKGYSWVAQETIQALQAKGIQVTVRYEYRKVPRSLEAYKQRKETDPALPAVVKTGTDDTESHYHIAVSDIVPVAIGDEPRTPSGRLIPMRGAAFEQNDSQQALSTDVTQEIDDDLDWRTATAKAPAVKIGASAHDTSSRSDVADLATSGSSGNLDGVGVARPAVDGSRSSIPAGRSVGQAEEAALDTGAGATQDAQVQSGQAQEITPEQKPDTGLLPLAADSPIDGHGDASSVQANVSRPPTHVLPPGTAPSVARDSLADNHPQVATTAPSPAVQPVASIPVQDAAPRTANPPGAVSASSGTVQASGSVEQQALLNGYVPDKPAKRSRKKAVVEDEQPKGPPQMPPEDAPWGTRTCLQLFDYWRGAPLLDIGQIKYASGCASRMAANYSREKVTLARTTMNADSYWIERGGADVCDVARNIQKQLNRLNGAGKPSMNSNAPAQDEKIGNYYYYHPEPRKKVQGV